MNLKNKNTILFFCFLFLICFFAFKKESIETTSLFENEDKVKHVLAFFILSYFLFCKSINIKLSIKIFILILIAFLIEYSQSFFYRESSFFDFLASCIGIILYVVGDIILKKFRSN